MYALTPSTEVLGYFQMSLRDNGEWSMLTLCNRLFGKSFPQEGEGLNREREK